MIERPIVPGAERADCGCGCGLYGVLRAQVMRDGKRHVKRCACKRCEGRRFGQRERSRVRKMARRIGAERDPMSGAVSGRDAFTARLIIEETAGARYTRGFRRWIEGSMVRAKLERVQAQAMLDREWAFMLSWDGRPQYVVMSAAGWERLAGLDKE